MQPPPRAAGAAGPDPQVLHPGSPHHGRVLPLDVLDANTASGSLEALGFDGLSRLCRQATAAHAPDRSLAVDPRSALPIVYSEARAGRLTLSDDVCVVCDDRTCPAVDRVELPDGDHAWLTPNLYPIVFPFAADDAATAHDGRRPVSLGVHLVHWSSRHHDRGWPGAPAERALALHRQLARAEELLLHGAPAGYPDVGAGHRGHVGIIKNRGRKVGGSVEHDHQQILLSAVAPNELSPSSALAGRLLAETPAELVVERGDGVVLLVAPFMRRPLHAFVVPRAGPVGWLHHLPPDVLDETALLVARLTAAANRLMQASHGEPAWNLVWHLGPGGSPLLELRAYTQPLGGYEHMGIYLCEERPETTAGRLREALG